jgi:CBS domain containing-hemolysin-like protein
MGDLVSPSDEEEQIIRRDEHSWLIDGVTPVEDVMRVLQLDDMPHDDEYETLGGFPDGHAAPRAAPHRCGDLGRLQV